MKNAHRMSEVSTADRASSGEMNSLTKVGIPAKALRTKLKCLKLKLLPRPCIGEVAHTCKNRFARSRLE